MNPNSLLVLSWSSMGVGRQNKRVGLHMDATSPFYLLRTHNFVCRIHFSLPFERKQIPHSRKAVKLFFHTTREAREEFLEIEKKGG
jgi:hypothetical protein